jgi:hypothetical protein
MRMKLKEVKATLMRRRHDPIPVLGAWLASVVQGYFNHHAIPGNSPRLESLSDVCRSLDATTHDPAPAPQRSLLHHTPEVGAVCGNAARTDLCGGPLERVVPTVTDMFTFNKKMSLIKSRSLSRSIPYKFDRAIYHRWDIWLPC